MVDRSLRLPLARKLKSRGHEVFLSLLDVNSDRSCSRFGSQTYDEKEYPVGSIAEAYVPISKLHGIEIILYQLRKLYLPLAAVTLENLPEKVVKFGLNTALAQGVPVVAISIGNDQLGVAARIAHHGVGKLIEVDELIVDGLTESIETVLNQTKYQDRARVF